MKGLLIGVYSLICGGMVYAGFATTYMLFFR
jgi:hypothetical protein